MRDAARGAQPDRRSGEHRSTGIALVTGASRGIGAATARALGAAGWPVAVGYHGNEVGAQATVEAIGSAGGMAAAIRADVADPRAADGLIGAAEERLGGPVLCLVNNAGIRADGLSPQLSDEQWDDVIATNLSAAFRLTRRVLKPMIRARHGRIINIASVVGLRANPGQANYAAAKGGLVAFTKTVASEVARRGVTVNAVAPGLIETDMTNGVGEQLLAHVPARRAGTPADVAACVRFLASDEAAYVTGTTLTVDGGLSA